MAGVDGRWNADSGVSPTNSVTGRAVRGADPQTHSIRCPPSISCTVGTLSLAHQQSLSVRPLLNCDTEHCRESPNWPKSPRKHRSFSFFPGVVQILRWESVLRHCDGRWLDYNWRLNNSHFLIALLYHCGFKWSGIWLSFLWKTADKWCIHIQNMCIINLSSGLCPEISQRFSQKCSTKNYIYICFRWLILLQMLLSLYLLYLLPWWKVVYQYYFPEENKQTLQKGLFEMYHVNRAAYPTLSEIGVHFCPPRYNLH